ncbi:MAG: hypothetical protein DMF53_05640 [Acidobacteria bacterium]|nr:MAG: hypothetical protein DMF53_05640 [Acidobacteriota bacterium]
MKTTQPLLPFLLLIVFAALLVGAAGERPATYSTEVSIQPNGDNVYVLKAKVKDAVSGEVLAGPILKMPAGQTATAESTLSDSDTVVSLSANVDGGKRLASYTITVKRGNRVVSEHTANVAL